MRVLVVTKIFPNAVEPLSSAFNRQQFAALGRLCDTEVMATIPWFPGASRFGKWSNAGRLGAVPDEEIIEGLRVLHPRFFFVPRYGHAFSGALYAASLVPHVLRYRKKIDVLLAAWAYPDGAAAVMLGRLLGVPVVVKLHGSDINVVAELPGPRQNLKWLLPKASRVVAVSRPLGEKVVELGVARARLRVVYNGVDGALFHPRDRGETRRGLGWPSVDDRLVVYVGRLEREKGVLDLLDAMSGLSSVKLALVGDGRAKAECEKRAAESEGRIRVLGARPLTEVPLWMAASDCVVLPSWNEGTPNVVLEALNCGRRVVATAVGGVPDILDHPSLGALVPAKDPTALREALAKTATEPYDPAEIARRGGRGDWNQSARALLNILDEAVAEHDAGGAHP